MDFKKYRWLLRLATDIIPKLPDRKDGPIKCALKVFAIADSVAAIKRGGKEDGLSSFFRMLDVEPMRNQWFVDMFWNTSIREGFHVLRAQISDSCAVLVCSHPILGRLYFVEYSWSGVPEIDQDFWYLRGFDFEAALEHLWKQYGSRVHVELKKNERGRVRAEYSSVPNVVDPILGDAKDKLGELVARHRRYTEDGIQRTYLFAGMQGCGKTTMAMRFASQIGGRLLRLDANGLTESGTHEIDFLINQLKPDCVLVDDLDRAYPCTAALLSILADFRFKHSNVTVLITGNNIGHFPDALIRPGRVDEIYMFNPPSPKEREVILRGYMDDRDMNGSLSGIVQKSEGLTAAYLRELALQTRYRSPEEVEDLAEQMVDIFVPKKKDKGEVPSEPACVPKAVFQS